MTAVNSRPDTAVHHFDPTAAAIAITNVPSATAPEQRRQQRSAVGRMAAERGLFSYPLYRQGEKPAPFLPMSRAEMKQLGWDSCDVILVVGDAYVDHPSFGMAVV